MPSYLLMPLAIGIIGTIIGVTLALFIGIPEMLGIYEDIIGIPILETTSLPPLVSRYHS